MNSPAKIIPSIILMMMSLCLYGYGDSIENDTIRPQLTVQPTDLLVQCSSDYNSELNDWFSIDGGALASDNSGVVEIETTIALSEIQDSLDNSFGTICNPDNVFEVGFYAIDTCGNTSLDTTFARFQVIDRQRPDLITAASSVILHCDEFTQDSLDRWVMSFGGAEATDACSPSVEWFSMFWSDNQGNSNTSNPTTGPFIPVDRNSCGWEVTVSFRVRDLCGNDQITTASFSLTDTIAPRFVDPQRNIEVACSDALETIGVSDNCNTNLVPTFEDLSSTRSADSTACEFYNYSLNRLWTVTDECGNSASFEQMINVVDTIIPSFVVPPDITIFCADDAQTIVTGFPTDVSDNCNPNPLVIFTDSGDSEGCEFVISRFWQIADGCGSSNIVPQQITVMDTISPNITVAASDINLSCEDPDSLVIKFDDWLGNIGGASAVDDCASVDWFAAVPGSYDVNDSSTFPGDLINSIDDLECGSAEVAIDFVFVDACDNATVTSAFFILTDTIAPSFDEPFEEIILRADSTCMVNTIMLFPEVSDNCVQDSQVVKRIRFEDILVEVQDGRFDTLLRSGVYDFTYLIEDCSGNSDSIVSTITILDTIPPVVVCPAGIETEVDLATCIAEVMLPTNFLTQENCDLGFLSYNVSGGTTIALDTIETGIDSVSIAFNAGTNLVEYIASDASGNQASCMLTVEVSDLDGQDIECKNEIIYLPISSATPFVLSDSVFIENLVDNCFIDSISTPVMSVTCDQVGTTIGVNLRIFDRTGNFQNCTSILQVEVEQINATFESKFCTSDTLKLFSNIAIDGDIDQNVYSWTGPNSYASSVANPVLTAVDSTFAGAYFLTVTGESGCNQVDTVMVEIESFETPSLNSDTQNICLGDTILLEASPYDFSVVYSYFEGIFPDGNLIDTSSVNSISFAPIAGVEDYYVIVDKDGCSSSPSNIVNISSEDILPPLITCPSDTIINIDSTSCLISFLLPTDFTVMDNCGFADSLVLNYSVTGEELILSDSIVGDGSMQVDSLLSGSYTATYHVLDLANNADSCSYAISVIDNILPEINCKNDSINLSISELSNFSIADLDILISATDNCELDTILYSPNNIDCAQLGEQISINLSARDASGNISECVAQVNVTLDSLIINSTSGLCPGDTLILGTNIIDPVGLEFNWSGPADFASNDPSPIISNPTIQNNGLYTLSVGTNSCTVQAELDLEVVEFATPTVTSEFSTACVNTEIQLVTLNYGGNITYKWYEGESPNGELIAELEQPTFTITPEIGNHDYYVVVSNLDCTSDPSDVISVEIVDQPSVSVSHDSILVCDGEIFNLNVENVNDDLSYEWIGPNGFTSVEANPDENLVGSNLIAGLYQVTSRVGECVSDTARINIVLQNVGEQPIIIGEENICNGSPINLEVENIINADNYVWLQNGVEYSTTQVNSLVIFNSTEEFAGEWSVFVEGSCGVDTSEVISISISEELIVRAFSNSPLCGSESLQLEVTDISDASYAWEGPDGFTSTERNPLITPVAGTYNVTVSATADCESTASTEVIITGRPTVQEIQSNITPCGINEEDLRLTPIIDSDENFFYEWIGPNGFTSNEEIAVIENFSSQDEGVYSLIIANGVCESLPSNIVISEGAAIDVPVINGNEEICIGQSITLVAENLSIEVEEFIWTTPNGQEVTTEPRLTIANVDDSNSGQYTVRIESGDCVSDESDSFTIDVGNGISTPIIISNGPFCIGETIQLEIANENGEYEWRGPNDFEATNANPVIFNVSDIFIGEYEVRVTSGDCTSPWSEPFSLQLVDIPEAPVATLTEDVLCSVDFGSYDFCIQETSLIDGANYTWINESTGDTIGISNSACLTITSVESFRAGRNNVNAFSSIGSCFSELSPRVTITLANGVGGVIDANAGEDLSICEDFVELQSTLLDGESGVWSSPNENIDFGDDIDPMSTVMGFDEGENILVWTVQGESCSGMGVDTVSVFYAFEPVALDDEFDFASGEVVVFNPLENDELPSDFVLDIISISGGDNLDASDPMAIRLGLGDGIGGQIEVVYEVCNEACSELCSQATARLNIEEQEECVVTTLITPNGDGLNDNFEIPCLENESYPGNQLTIFNQWGDEVYVAQPYQNDWQGTYNNEDLPVGTYFFILNLGEGLQLQDGFIQLER